MTGKWNLAEEVQATNNRPAVPLPQELFDSRCCPPAAVLTMPPPEVAPTTGDPDPAPPPDAARRKLGSDMTPVSGRGGPLWSRLLGRTRTGGREAERKAAEGRGGQKVTAKWPFLFLPNCPLFISACFVYCRTFRLPHLKSIFLKNNLLELPTQFVREKLNIEIFFSQYKLFKETIL